MFSIQMKWVLLTEPCKKILPPLLDWRIQLIITFGSSVEIWLYLGTAADVKKQTDDQKKKEKNRKTNAGVRAECLDRLQL